MSDWLYQYLPKFIDGTSKQLRTSQHCYEKATWPRSSQLFLCEKKLLSSRLVVNHALKMKGSYLRRKLTFYSQRMLKYPRVWESPICCVCLGNISTTPHNSSPYPAQLVNIPPNPIIVARKQMVQARYELHEKATYYCMDTYSVKWHFAVVFLYRRKYSIKIFDLYLTCNIFIQQQYNM